MFQQWERWCKYLTRWTSYILSIFMILSNRHWEPKIEVNCIRWFLKCIIAEQYFSLLLAIFLGEMQITCLTYFIVILYSTTLDLTSSCLQGLVDTIKYIAIKYIAMCGQIYGGSSLNWLHLQEEQIFIKYIVIWFQLLWKYGNNCHRKSDIPQNIWPNVITKQIKL